MKQLAVMGVFDLPPDKLIGLHEPPTPKTPLVAPEMGPGCRRSKMPPILIGSSVPYSFPASVVKKFCPFCCLRINNRDLTTKEQETDRHRLLNLDIRNGRLQI